MTTTTTATNDGIIAAAFRAKHEGRWADAARDFAMASARLEDRNSCDQDKKDAEWFDLLARKYARMAEDATV